MSDVTAPRLAKWPFIMGDVLLLVAAYLIYAQSTRPLSGTELSLAVLCVICGAVFSIVPFVLEYRAMSRVAEAGALTTVTARLSQLETIAGQISTATGRWQNVQEEAEKTAAGAKDIAEKMGAEVKEFTQFMQRVNDTEKSTLRLEVEKLRRSEADWVQVLVRMLDHVYALHVGAIQSGQPNLIEQVSQFQNACRDVARRVGVVPFLARPTEPFDSKRHQLMDGNGTPPESATVADTIATGYTFQGRLVRPALVRLNAVPTAGIEPIQPPTKDVPAAQP